MLAPGRCGHAEKEKKRVLQLVGESQAISPEEPIVSVCVPKPSVNAQRHAGKVLPCEVQSFVSGGSQEGPLCEGCLSCQQAAV